jgi:integrase
LLVPAVDVALAARAERRREYASHAKAEGTWKVYDGHWKRFLAFCSAAGLEPGPPTAAEVLADWIVHLREQGKAASSLSVAVAAVSHRNRLAACSSPAEHPQVAEVLAGARRLAAVAGAGRGPSDPMLPEDLRKMIARLKPGLVGTRDAALLSFGLGGGFRREELSRIEVRDLRFEEHAVRVTLRRSKTDQEGRGHERRVCRGDFIELCPVRNLQTWLAAASIREGFVFRPIVYGKVIRDTALSARRIDQIVREYTRAILKDDPTALGGRKYSAHSLRSGLCTAAALAGKPEYEIREHVGHRSAATTARYIRAAGRRVSSVTKGIGL